MRAENARLGVETTMKNDLTARSATYPRSRSSNDQRQSARADREWLEKCQQGGPRMGSSSGAVQNASRVVQGWGAVQQKPPSSLDRLCSWGRASRGVHCGF